MRVVMRFDTVLSGLGILEAPRVDEDGTIYFSELVGEGGVHRLFPDGSHEVLLKGRQLIGGVVLNSGGGLVLSGGRDAPLSYWNEATEEIHVLATDLDGVPITAVNDIQADEHGSVWAGTYDANVPTTPEKVREMVLADRLGELAGEHAVPGERTPVNIFRVDADGTVTKLWEEGIACNGLGFSPDGRIFYQCDTILGVFAYDLTEDRRLANRRLLGRVPRGRHNGLAVDAEGGVWVAAVGGGSIVRFLPDGAIDQIVPVPAVAVMSLTFGGADLQDLYIVTADNLDDPRLLGSVFHARSEIPGLRSPKSSFHPHALMQANKS